MNRAALAFAAVAVAVAGCAPPRGPRCNEMRAAAAEVIDVEPFAFPAGDVQCRARFASVDGEQAPPTPPSLFVVISDEAALADELTCVDAAGADAAPPPSGVDFTTSLLVIEYQANDFGAVVPTAALVDADGEVSLLHEVQESCGSGAVPPPGFFATMLVLPAGDATPTPATCVFGPSVDCGGGFSQPP